MTKQMILTAIVAAFPSYASLFCDGVGAGILLGLATICFLLFTGYEGANNEDDKGLIDKIRTGWIIHLLGVAASIAVHNL